MVGNMRGIILKIKERISIELTVTIVIGTKKTHPKARSIQILFNEMILTD